MSKKFISTTIEEKHVYHHISFSASDAFVGIGWGVLLVVGILVVKEAICWL
ncbi:MAG: hypothetical protein LBM12_00655 [Candidatus Nomurabacteria bacterium]|nr:hypothetical protein [Candidatus Nomurabacteria bacterium]